MKNITKLKNTTNEKYRKIQCTENTLPTALTASSELTRTCVRHRFHFLLIRNVILSPNRSRTG